MQIGLFGKANVGKSTFFSAATETPVPTGNFPFTTIEPNIGVAYVKTDCACKHFGIKHEIPLCVNGTRFIPVKLIDIAGLVPGAHEGKGLGNQFLDDARQAEVLIHVVDISGSTDIQGQPVQVGSHDPLEDIEFVISEFDQWFKQILEREWQKLSKEIEQKTVQLVDGIAKRFSGLGIKDYEVQEVLQSTGLLTKKPTEWNANDLSTFVKELRKNTKPILIAANKADLCKDLKLIEKIKDEKVIPCSAETELLLRKASKSGLVDYVPGSNNFSLKENIEISSQQKNALDVVHTVFSKIETTGIQKTLNSAVFDVLKAIVVYPVEDETKFCNKDGVVFPDAKLLADGSTAKDLAAIIHADIAKGFLHAIDCKTKQRIGAEHKLKNGDVVKIVSTLSRG
ncbi:MAG: GTP-binding and nucleic acid-binding protein YchF [Marine Group I thaumarchaeote]|nr:MAG: GTP-binding and nucleic acid-binding protein YchF [Marine Group I thaumarchaeote]